MLLTLGTGLGGGIILNGKMFNGGMNHGVELGHAYLVDGGEPCTCGNLGCMEAYCCLRPHETPPRHAGAPRDMLTEQTGGDPGKITPSSSPTAQRRATRRRRPCSTRISSI